MRKILTALVGLVVAVFGFFHTQLGLPAVQINMAGLVGALLLLGAWVVMQARQDLAALKANVTQEAKWSDATWWGSILAALVLPFSANFGVTLSDDLVKVIALVLSIVVPILMKIFRKNVPTEPVA